MAEDLIFHCPLCKIDFTVLKDVRGDRIECPDCGQEVEEFEY